MSLTVQDIQDKQFHVRFRGFDIEEVDAFLELIGENFSAILLENKELTQNVESLTKELDCVKKQESSFRNAIISAQKISDELLAKSNNEAAAILAKAEEEVKLLKDEAHCEVAELEGRVDELRGMQAEFENDINKVIQSYQEKLNDSSFEAASIPHAGDLADHEPVAVEPASSEGEPDLADLYEKIDLGENLGEGSSLLGNAKGASSAQDGDDKEVKCIPDLDSDIVFTLHDPLDDIESSVDVVIDHDKE